MSAEEAPAPQSSEVSQPPTVTGAVFLSYASDDTHAAEQIATALRTAGIQVWFDKSELRGGEAWDRQIRKQIHDCALFLAIISAHSDARHEGYFRREWRLAVERAGDMAEDVPFLLPVVVDATTDATARVPDRFREVQWLHLPGGEVSTAFVERVQRLLSHAEPRAPTVTRPGRGPASPVAPTMRAGTFWGWKPALLVAVAMVILAAVAYLIVDRSWISKPPPASRAPVSAAGAAFVPPPRSIAVLPFVNMSGDKNQDYFSEGLTEELLNSLAEVNELQVAARTSSFSFQGEHPDIATVAHKLNVASVLEGSVRRSGHTVRITAQLINAVTGFHLWSKSYDRDLGDVLKLQTEIATAVAGALKVTLLGGEAAKIELGGTHNPAALDAYLRGSKAWISQHDASSLQSAMAAYTEAIRLDPNYALAFAGRSRARFDYASGGTTGRVIREDFDRAQADARQAIRLAPELAEGHSALAISLAFGSLDFTEASEAYDRAMTLSPGNAQVLRDSGRFAVLMGRVDTGLAALHRAVALDPINPQTRELLGEALLHARRYEEAVGVFGEVLNLEADFERAAGFRGLAYYGLGDLRSARSACQTKPDFWASQWCLAIGYDKSGQHSEAEATLKKLQATYGESGAYQYAAVYAQWGNTAEALQWLATARRARDPGLAYLKTDPLLDPLRQEPRFQAMMRELKFPE